MYIALNGSRRTRDGSKKLDLNKYFSINSANMIPKNPNILSAESAK
jgi:hypothetical protein